MNLYHKEPLFLEPKPCTKRNLKQGNIGYSRGRVTWLWETDISRQVLSTRQYTTHVKMGKIQLKLATGLRLLSTW